MEQTQFSETFAYKIQMPRNYTEESIQQVSYMFGGFRPTFGAGAMSKFKTEFFIFVLLPSETDNPNGKCIIHR